MPMLPWPESTQWILVGNLIFLKSLIQARNHSSLCIPTVLLCYWVSHVWFFVTAWTAVHQTPYGIHMDSPGKITGVACHALLQGIFPTRGLNSGLLDCRKVLLPFEPPGKPKNTGVGSLSLLQGNLPTQESNWDLLHCRWIPYQLSYAGSPYTCPIGIQT